MRVRAALSHPQRSDTGSVSVEFALALPAIVAVLAACLSAGAWMLDISATQRAASEAARVGIVGTDAEALAAGARIAPHAGVRMSRTGSDVIACASTSNRWWPRVTRCSTARSQ